MRYRLSIGVVTLLAAAAATTAPAAWAAQVAPPPTIASAGQIVYCMDISFPPFESYSSSHQAVGSDVDLGTALAKLMGVKAVFRNTSFNGIIPALQSSQCDAIISGLYDKASRRKVVNFVDYAILGNSVVVPKGNPHHINGMSGLSGLTVGVESGTTLALQLQAENAKLKAAGKPPMTIQTYPTDSGAFQQLIAGNVQAYYTVTSTADYYAKKDGDKTQIAGPQVAAYPFGIATRKNETSLHQAFVTGLADLRKSGKYLAILTKWGIANAALKG